ncbi:cytidine deaminase [Clostridiaceae bacterium HSG29]|nr:cytidine deaminase [Clostridiaceae bacterium HSG29]
MKYEELMEIAREAQKKAYVPYSNFKVGAALLTKNGKVFTGCNVEIASLGATNCAERTAIFKAVSEGETEYKAIAITGDSDLTYPCGICRQVIVEFGDDIDIIVDGKNGLVITNINELLPHSFTGKDLKELK